MDRHADRAQQAISRLLLDLTPNIPRRSSTGVLTSPAARHSPRAAAITAAAAALASAARFC